MNDPLKYSRKLMTILMISGGLNVVLISIFFYWTIRERPPTPYFELKPANLQQQQSPLAIDHSNSEVIRYFRKMPMDWLIARLHNTKLVESGYSQRDLALASLIAFHHFDIDRALRNLPSEQTRTIIYGKYKDGSPAELKVYPGLSDHQYEAIQNFVATERWPLTSKGLFFALRKQAPDFADHSLLDAFLMTPEFLAVEMLFSRGEASIDKREILNVLLQGNWNLLSSFAEQQKSSQDLSAARRQTFLLEYIRQKSKAAAFLILKSDGDFAAQKLDDSNVILILELLEKSPEAEQFALKQLTSPRTDLVWNKAAVKLFEYAGESIPEKDLLKSALLRFVPGHKLVNAAKVENSRVAGSYGFNVSSTSNPASLPKESDVTILKPKIAAKELPPTKKTMPKKPVTPKPTSSKPIPIPKSKPIASSVPASKMKNERTYTVQEGDSLWKIAQKHHVDVAALRALNKLENDSLRPGRVLKIP